MQPPVDQSLGKVWLVGAGPGDPDLITVRGRDVLRRADVVLYDALSHPALLQECRHDADVRNVGKRGGRQSPSQSWITQQLIDAAKQGRAVVRLKGGDSFLFARGAEEAEALAVAGVPFEVVPGLSSPVGTSAYAGIPLTHRELSSSVTFITGSDKDGKAWSDVAWQKLATATDTLCVLMGMRRIEAISAAIVAGGRRPETPVAVIQWGARPSQRVLVSTLRDVADEVRTKDFSNPAVIIIGEVVALREQLAWFERTGLFGKRVLVPRDAEQGKTTSALIRSLGGEPLAVPVIRIEAPPDARPLQDAVRRVGEYDWLAFTSQNGVDAFFLELTCQERDARALAGVRVAAVGKKTAAALRRQCVHPDFVAKTFEAKAFADEFVERYKEPSSALRVLFPSALVAREALPAVLTAAGMKVDRVPAYQTLSCSDEQRETLLNAFSNAEVDVVLFTSGSTVANTCQALGRDAAKLLSRVVVATIGPVTTQAAEELGVTVHVTPDEYTVEALLRAVATYLSAHD